MRSRGTLYSMFALCSPALSACDSPIAPAESLVPAAVTLPVGTACPNEPAGWIVASDRTFVPLATPKPAPNGKELDAGWVSSGAFSLAQDATAPDGDGWVGQERYSTANRVGNGTMGSWPATTFIGKRYKSLYTCYMMKVDPNYIGEASSVNKQFWFEVGSSNENRMFSVMHMPGQPVTASSALWLGARYQGLDNMPSSPIIYSSKMPVSRGAWHRFEMMAQLESSKGATDGWIKTYTDGQLATTTSGLRFTHTGEVLEWRAVKWANIYGGGTVFCTSKDKVTGLMPTQIAHPECFVPHTQYVWMDAQRVLVH